MKGGDRRADTRVLFPSVHKLQLTPTISTFTLAFGGIEWR
jgi:hypothetical protein